MKYKANCKVGDKFMLETEIIDIYNTGGVLLGYDGRDIYLNKNKALEEGLSEEVHEVKVGQVYADEDDRDACREWEVVHIRDGAVLVLDRTDMYYSDTFYLTDKFFCKDNLVKDVD